MNLFSKKIAVASILAISSISLMSFNQKSEDYGQSVKVSVVAEVSGQRNAPALTGYLVRTLVRAAGQAARLLTPELEVPLQTLFGFKEDNSSVSKSKQQKLHNLDK